MNRSNGSSVKFAGFWCKYCGGRVFEEDPYWDGNNHKFAVVQCTHCSREHHCRWKDYVNLVNQIEQFLINKNKKR